MNYDLVDFGKIQKLYHKNGDFLIAFLGIKLLLASPSAPIVIPFLCNLRSISSYTLSIN